MMSPRYGIAQRTSLAGLRGRFPGVTFARNNMFQNDTCDYDLLGNAYGGGVIENYGNAEASPGTASFSVR